MTYKTKAISYDERRLVFWTLASLILASLVVYVYAINATTRHVAERQELEREITSLSSSIASREFAYIDLKNAISMKVAEEYGFQEVRTPLYVSRTPTRALTLATPKR